MPAPRAGPDGEAPTDHQTTCNGGPMGFIIIAALVVVAAAAAALSITSARGLGRDLEALTRLDER